MSERRLVYRHAPSLAGGPLRLLNGVLWTLAEARRRGAGWRAVLELDESLLRPQDRKLLLLSAQGNPVKLPGPENGRFDPAGRAALAAAAVDAMPPTAEAAQVVDRLLPAAGLEPLEAELKLWRELLGGAGLEVVGRSAAEAGAAGAAERADDPEALEYPEITWYGVRHLQALQQFGADPAIALEGETRLKKALTPPAPVKLAAELERLQEQTAARVEALEGAVREEEPRLYGSWCRLRRDSQRAVQGFVRQVERSLRNRDGIRGSRLRALCQGLRPYDGPQQEGLGLMTAAASFQLELDRLDAAIPSLESAGFQASLLVESSSGRLIS